MKELMDILFAKEEGFKKEEIVKYGVVIPTLLVIGCLLGSVINAI